MAVVILKQPVVFSHYCSCQTGGRHLSSHPTHPKAWARHRSCHASRHASSCQSSTYITTSCCGRGGCGGGGGGAESLAQFPTTPAFAPIQSNLLSATIAAHRATAQSLMLESVADSNMT